MAIQLDQISVKNLGPLESLDLQLGLLNLIYGQNESGKTYLVEFLLQALFRQAPDWKLREVPGRGQATVSGLTSNQVKFSPKTKKKIEDYWEEEDLGLPLNMSRLLVVKGGELDLTDSPGGVNKTILKTALTNEYLLDHIREPISKTVQVANLFNNEIIGANRGVLKDREDLRLEIVKLQSLLEQVEEKYSLGPLKEIEQEIDQATKALSRQEEAKLTLAHRLRGKLQESKQELGNLPEEILNGLRDDLRDLQKARQTQLELKENLVSIQEISRNYPWLETAISVWEKMNLEGSDQPSRWIIYVGVSLLLLGLILLGINDLIMDFDLFWGAIAFVIISGGLNLYHLLRLQRWASGIHKFEEKESIQLEYKNRFGANAGGLSDLKAQLRKIQPSHFQLEPLERSIQQNKRIQAEFISKIKDDLRQLTGINIPEEEWEGTYHSLAKRSSELKDTIQKLEFELQKLDVPEEHEKDYQPEEDYDPELTQELTRKLDDLLEKQNDSQNQLNSLKQLICHETGDDISLPWRDALYHLRSIHQEKQSQYRKQTARLVAEIGVVQVLDLIEQEEDLKIQNDINSSDVTQLINKITGRYQSLELIDDRVYVSDQYSQYPLTDLSTGAREQILLALRMGIASQISQGEPLFLILDDAFQHSDWERREMLVQTIVNMAKNRWQIIYLTMDDHLRELVSKQGKKELGKEFQSFTLE